MLYLTTEDNDWACDIEADNFLEKASRIWCCCVKNIGTGESLTFLNAKEFNEWKQKTNPQFIGHNFIAYDAPMLNKHWQAGISISKIKDTFVLSQLYNPTIAGGHSLEDWGKRLKFLKGDYSDFTKFTPEMLEYCINDVALTALCYYKLSSRMVAVGFSELGCEIEHLAWNIIQNKQRRHGFPFNKQAAEELYATLQHRRRELEREIYALFPPKLLVVGRYKKAFKGDGTKTALYSRCLEQYPKVEVLQDGGLAVYDYVSFNIGSPKQRIEKLLTLGWEPTHWNTNPKTKKRTSPKVDEDSLTAFAEKSGIPGVAAISKWVVVSSRLNNMLKPWLDNYNEDTKSIHGKLFIASTLRYRHSSPNTANISAVKTEKIDDKETILLGEAGGWAYECRDLWHCGDRNKYSLVGVDAKGIQIRILLNYAYSESAFELYTKGDPHVNNARILGLANKAAGKKFFYCVPMHTKALTKEGWKSYEELKKGELVLTFNKYKRIQEWQPVLEKVYFEDAPLVELSNQTFKVQCTPNHRWFTQQRKTKTKYKDTKIEVKTVDELSTMQNIIINAPLIDHEPSCGVDWTKLSKYDTDWERIVLQMSQQERRAFLSGFCIADGYSDNNGNWRWSQLRGPLFEAALLASYLEHDGTVTVSTRIQGNGNSIGTALLGKKPHTTTAFIKKTELPSAPVWCIRTENESWVMRQGDVITITGNTLIMGGAGARLAADQLQFGTKLTAKQGNEMKEKMIATIPGFEELIQRLEGELSRTGRIKLCDGSPIIVPSPHMVIPYLLQGDESRIMKLSGVYLDKEIRKEGLDANKVGDIHDEWQFVVCNRDVPRFMEMALTVFPKVGEFFNYKVKIEGSAKVGKTWAGTH